MPIVTIIRMSTGYATPAARVVLGTLYPMATNATTARTMALPTTASPTSTAMGRTPSS